MATILLLCVALIAITLNLQPPHTTGGLWDNLLPSQMRFILYAGISALIIYISPSRPQRKLGAVMYYQNKQTNNSLAPGAYLAGQHE